MRKEVGILPLGVETSKPQNPGPIGRCLCLMEMNGQESTCHQGLVWLQSCRGQHLDLCMHLKHSGRDMLEGPSSVPGISGPRQGRRTPALSSLSGPTHAQEHCAEEPRSVCAVSGFLSFGGGWTVTLSSLSSQPGPCISFRAAIQSTPKWVTLHHGKLLSSGLEPRSPT